MKTSLLAAAVIASAALFNLSPASAARYQAPNTAGTWHYEWQYHYVGHHPRYQGDWVLVR
jgi:hypothetical protein